MHKKQLYSQTTGGAFFTAQSNRRCMKTEHGLIKQSMAQKMKMGTKKQKASTISSQKRVLLKPKKDEDPLLQVINEEHENKNIEGVTSQVKIYVNPGETPRRGIFNRKDSEKKLINEDVFGRGKSLNYKKIQPSSSKFLTQVRDFFNTFISEDDGCSCGPECKWTGKLMNLYGVPKDKIKNNYSRLLSKAYQNKSSPNYFELSQNFNHEQSIICTKQLSKHLAQIQKDVTRTQTQCKLFLKKQVQDKLQRILLCYTVEDPDVGYVQSMNIVVSGILYHVRDQAQTYAIARKIFHQMRTVYLRDFKQCYEHVEQVRFILKKYAFDLFSHLQKTGVDFGLIMFPWIVSLMCVIVPLDKLHKIYVGFGEGGWKFIEKVILSLMLYLKQTLMELGDANDILVFLSSLKEDGREVDWQGIFDFVHTLKIGT